MIECGLVLALCYQDKLIYQIHDVILSNIKRIKNIVKCYTECTVLKLG